VPGFRAPGPVSARKFRRACGTRSGCKGRQAGFNAVYDCIKAFSETDRTDDLKKFDVPTLVIQGDDDRGT
jgi:pimeloyl-ACP methyl ester carboxylesterase